MGGHDVLAKMPAALDRFGSLVREVPRNRWDSPTPCDRWTVRDLVNHVTGEQLWAPHLLRGETMDDVGDRYDDDVLGHDPTATWERAAAAARDAWTTLAPQREHIDSSMGALPVQEYAQQMYLDLVVHAWDLARGAGLDESMPPDAAQAALDYAEPHAGDFAGSGVFAPPLDVQSADPGERLLALTGRDPR